MANVEILYVAYINVGNLKDDAVQTHMTQQLDLLKETTNKITSANILWMAIPIRTGDTRIEELYYRCTTEC